MLLQGKVENKPVFILIVCLDDFIHALPDATVLTYEKESGSPFRTCKKNIENIELVPEI